MYIKEHKVAVVVVVVTWLTRLLVIYRRVVCFSLSSLNLTGLNKRMNE